MTKLNYDKLLKNFKSIKISINKFEDLCLYDDMLVGYDTGINSRELSKQFGLKIYNISRDDVTHLAVKKDGIYYDINKLLLNICKFYGLKVSEIDESCISDTMEKLRNMKDFKQLANLSTELYKKFCMRLKHTKKDSYKKQISIAAKKETRRKLKKLKELYKAGNLENEIEYQTRKNQIIENSKSEKNMIFEGIIFQKFIKDAITDLKFISKHIEEKSTTTTKVADESLLFVDEEKLELVLAYIVKEAAEKLPQDSNLYKDALNYLNNYIREREELGYPGFNIIHKCCNSYGIYETKEYSVSEIYTYFYKEESRNTENANKSLLPISFVDLGNSNKSREVLSKYFQIGTIVNNGNIDKLLEEKKTYYEELGYEKICVGVNSFDGYLGFCLDNGVVILDKIYEDSEKGIPAVDQAVYITTINEFDKVVNLTKAECMEKIKNKELNVVRVIHKEGWQDRVISRTKELAKK